MRVVEVGDICCKIGESAKENWELLDRAHKRHWFFHVSDFASCYVILECDREPSSEDKYRCAELCVGHSKQKKNKNVRVDATPCSNVVKSDEVGEVEYKNDGKAEVIVVKEFKGQVEYKTQPKAKAKEKAVPKAAPKAAAVPSAAEGESLSIMKHPTMGCARVLLKDAQARDAMLATATELVIGEVKVRLQPQLDKATREDVPTEIFAAWGRQVEKESPLPEADLLAALEELHQRASAAPAQAAADEPPAE